MDARYSAANYLAACPPGRGLQSVHGLIMTAKRFNACAIAVVGTGPYGLSVAAHLRSAGVSARVFGEPMSFWRRHMPKGMIIRSPWRATELSAPERKYSLDVYATAQGRSTERRLPLEEFIAYGDWFQENAVPDVDRRAVRRIDKTDTGFALELADGEIFAAGRVVVATGLANQDYRPPQFRDLPAELVSHSSAHADFAPFRGKHIAVIGGGQSACESAVLLSEAGATVELISSRPVHWLGDAAAAPTLAQRLEHALAAPSSVGPFPLSWLAEFPALGPYLPEGFRASFTERCLKPGASGWLRPRIGKIAFNPGRSIVAARVQAGQIELILDNGAAAFDHVVLGTGYRVDIARIGILAPQLLARIATDDGSPLLGAGFESSVPGLHFAGSYAVKSFGPLLRFIAGTPYCARAIAGAARARPAPGAVAALPKKAIARLYRAAAAALPR